MGIRLHHFLFRTVLLAALLAPAVYELSAQSLALTRIDPTDFPVISGEVLLYDRQGLPIFPLQIDNLSIAEEGLPRTITAVSCPDPGDPQPLSVVVAIDRSGSMITPLQNNLRPIDMVVTGVEGFLQTLDFASPTAVALTAFNERSLLLSDFRMSATPLENALSGLTATGGTLYDPPFLDPLSGAIDLLRGRPDSIRRIVLFITDGEPEGAPATELIIGGAQDAGVEVWAITVGGRMTPELQMIADRTGGEAWGEVNDPDALTGVMRRVAAISRGVEPCTVTWQSEVECGPGPVFRNVLLSESSSGLRARNRYRLPDQDLLALNPSARVLYFGRVQFPDISQVPVTITARNGDFTVTGAEFTNSDNFRVESWGGTNPPFTLADGESRTIQIRFIPIDSTTYAATLRFTGLPCDSRDILLAGGERSPEAEREPLVLRSPLGGESFNSCDSISIRWGGVEPDRAVRVQFSDGDGKGWKTISDSATGYELRWMPPAPGSSYRIRISTDAPEQHIITTIAGGGQFNEDSLFATDVALALPMGLDVRGNELYIAENGGHRVRRVDLQTGIITTLAGTGTSGNGGDGAQGPQARLNSPTDVYVAIDTIFITEYPRVRAMDTGTLIIESWAGNIYREFSPDGTHMANLGSLMVPWSVVADSQYIYISELDSHRVRKIDRTTRIISTVAGGGGTGGFDSDGRPATDAYLLLPRGLALRDSLLYIAEEVGHRVRVVNLNTGIIRTVAGNGTIGNTGDGGPARNATLNGPVDLELWGDTLLITDRYDNRIRMVNLRTGVINGFAGVGGPDGFGGDSGVARNARFASPTGLARHGDLLFVSDRLNNRVRQITLYRADGLDSSRSNFSVTAPQGTPGSGLVSFGPLPVDQRRDSVLTGFYCNTGDVPMTIDSMKIIGPNAAAFTITGGASDLQIPPGECRTLSIAFSPEAIGIRRAQLLLYGSCSLPDTIGLVGEGIPGCMITSIDRIELDPVLFGVVDEDRRDTTITGILCNDGNMPLSGSLRLFSPDGAWSLLSPTNYSLSPGECLDIDVRFAPELSGSSMASIEYDIDGPCEVDPTTLSGRSLRPGRLDGRPVELGTFACPETIDTVITLHNTGELPVSIVGLLFRENDEGFMFPDPLPDPSNPIVVPAEEGVSIPVRLIPTRAGEKRGVIRALTERGDSVIVEINATVDSIRIAPIESLVLMPRSGAAPWPRDTVIRFVNTGDRPVSLTGAGVLGDDPDQFEVNDAVFPIVVNPGDTIELPIRFLEPLEDRSYGGRIGFQADIPCAMPIDEVDLVLSGSSPLLRDASLTIDPIRCEGLNTIDTSLTLHNDGGGPLEIDGIEILDDSDGTLEVRTATPLVIPPGGSITIDIRYAPVFPGRTDARLRLRTNTANSPVDIPVTAVRSNVDFTVSPISLEIDQQSDGILTLTNTGDLPITWNLTSITGPFQVLSITPQTAAPGESSEVLIRFIGQNGGDDRGEIIVVEDICGQSRSISLRVGSSPALIELRLPVDSVMVNEPISIPVRYRLLSGGALKEEDSVEVEISFIGTTFFFEELDGGRILEEGWDRASETTTLRIAARFGDRRGDTLFVLEGLGLNGRFSATPLTFEEAIWSRPEVTVETINGHLTVLGLCLNEGLHISVRPPTLRSVLPHPIRGNARLQLDLPDWTSMRIRLVDARGVGEEIYRADYLPAGTQEIDLDLENYPAGTYTIVVETPHGGTSVGVVLRR